MIGASPPFTADLADSLADGGYQLRVAAADRAGNQATSATVAFTLDTMPPSPPTGLTAIDTPDDDGGSITLQWVAPDATDVTAQCVYRRATAGSSVEELLATVGPEASTYTDADSSLLDGTEYFYVIRAADRAGNVSVPSNEASAIPLDSRELQAPPLDQTVASNVFDSTTFLYLGTNPVQQGVAPGTIKPSTVAVLRGEVTTPDGAPIPGVKVSVLGHGELGWTTTRPDGAWDLAVNGGARLTVEFEKDGLLPVQRGVTSSWQDFAFPAPVVMIPLDPKVTRIDTDSPVPGVAQGSTVTDDRGTRQSTLVVPPGTSAVVTSPDGSSMTLTSFDVRATEYSVGDSGEAAMPGELPANSGFTYAVDLRLDEAGESPVTFSTPVPFYVDNFLTFPVGTAVPLGSYDRTEGRWEAAENGRVVKVVSRTNGMADLDIDGGGAPADPAALAALGITDAERARLAELYPDGKTLWRVRIPHFSAWDLNWPVGPPDDAQEPPETPPSNDPKSPSCQLKASIVGCPNQTLGEQVEVPGTPFTLNYDSGRVTGRSASRRFEIPISGPITATTLKRIDLIVEVAGRQIIQSYGPAPDQVATFEWDGLDAYGRNILGERDATVRIKYVYPGRYLSPGNKFAEFSVDVVPLPGGRATRDVGLESLFKIRLANGDTPAGSIGGWTLDQHHRYDPVGRVLLLGDGTRRDTATLEPELQMLLPTISHANVALTSAPDGTIYAGYGASILQIDRAGKIIRNFVPQSDPPVSMVNAVSALNDGSIIVYVGIGSGGRLLRIAANGTTTVIAGDGGPPRPIGYGRPATASFLPPGSGRIFGGALAVGPDGSIFLGADGGLIKVGVDGILELVSAGCSFEGANPIDGPVTQVCGAHRPAVAVDGNGDIYLAGSCLIRKITADGMIRTIMGARRIINPFCDVPSTPDGEAARGASVGEVTSLEVGPDGSIYFVELYGEGFGRNHTGGYRLRRIRPDGLLQTMAGGGASTKAFDGIGSPAVGANISIQFDFALAPDLSMVFESVSGFLRVAAPLPLFDGKPFSIVPSEDGTEIYGFDAAGRHLVTRDSLTGTEKWRFDYDSAGRLIRLTDGDSNVTTVERDAAGDPLAIVGSYGHRTDLEVDSLGYLKTIAAPATGPVGLTYSTGGLLATMIDARGGLHKYTYDSVGRLIRDENAADGVLTLERLPAPGADSIRVTTATGTTAVYTRGVDAGGTIRQTNTFPDGGQSTVVDRPDGTTTTTTPDGMVVEETFGPDPRFGMLSPILASSVTRTPSGLTRTETTSRQVQLSNPDDKLSLVRLVDTHGLDGRPFGTLTYTGVNRTYTAVSAENRSATVVTDSRGRVTEETLDGLAPRTYSYDLRGRLTSVAQADQSLTIEFGPDGLPALARDALGRETKYHYDAAGRAESAQAPSGSETKVDFDPAGAPTSIVQPSGDEHALSWTADSRLESHTPPEGSASTYAYRPDGFFRKATYPSGRTLAAGHDAFGRLVGLVTPEATVTQDLTADGRPTRLTRTPASGPAQELGITYDGGLVTQVAATGASTGTYGYRFGTALQVAGITFDSGTEEALTRDRDELLTARGPFTFTRAGPAGAVTGITDGTLAKTLTHDTLGRVTREETKVAGSVVAVLEYSYDAAGRVKTRTETFAGQPSVIVGFEYDLDGRLERVRRDGALVEQYGWDADGNRASRKVGTDPEETATYDPADHVLTGAGKLYAYDADGFLKSRGSDQFVYSANGGLLEATVGDQTVTYAYDALGRLVARTASAGTTQFLYGNEQDRLLVTATRAPDGVLTRYHYDEAGYLYGLERAESRFYVITDQIGTPRLVVDASASSGNAVKSLTFDAFGRVLADSDPAFDLPIGFAGGIVDPHVEFVKMGSRDYEPSTGRFITSDPSIFEGSPTNLMSYVDGDPINYLDREGLKRLNLQELRRPGLKLIIRLALDKGCKLPRVTCSDDVVKKASDSMGDYIADRVCPLEQPSGKRSSPQMRSEGRRRVEIRIRLKLDGLDLKKRRIEGGNLRMEAKF